MMVSSDSKGSMTQRREVLDADAPFLPPHVPVLPALSSASSSLGPLLDYSCV